MTADQARVVCVIGKAKRHGWDVSERWAYGVTLWRPGCRLVIVVHWLGPVSVSCVEGVR